MKATDTLRKLALGYPGTEEGIACKGTALERSTFKVGGKAFLFIGPKDGGWDARLKLGDSIPEAAKLAKKEPDRYQVGAHGWVAARFAEGQAPPKGLIERWIDESYRAFAPAAPKKAAKTR